MNKGEWAEIYLHCKLLAAGQIERDPSITSDTSNKFPIEKLMRPVAAGQTNYLIGDQEIEINFVDASNSALPGIAKSRKIKRSEFGIVASKLLTAIKKGKGSFDIPSVHPFLEEAGLLNTQDQWQKSDIYMRIYDGLLGAYQEIGFSVKSFLGSAPSILNASGSTIASYEITGCKGLTPKQLVELNQLEPRELVDKLIKMRGTISFDKFSNPILQANLQMNDSQMPKLLGDLILDYYKGNDKTIEKLVENLSESNPLNLDLGSNEQIYSHKFKTLLLDTALGMIPSKPWDGSHGAWGLINILKDGSVTCMPATARDELREYLFSSSKIDTPQKKSYPNGLYGVHFDGYRKYLNLNFQIRYR
jgi:type II restriction enzyme